jgi:hypothetical protein
MWLKVKSVVTLLPDPRLSDVAYKMIILALWE